MRACIHTHIQSTYIHTHKYVHTYTHTYIIHTYIQTCMHTYIIKTEEAVRLYNTRKIRGSVTQELDYVVEHKNWPHPADGAIIIEEEDTKESTVLAYTDGSKSELGVGSGTVIFIGKEIATPIKSRLDSKCSNNQAEQTAVINALMPLQL